MLKLYWTVLCTLLVGFWAAPGWTEASTQQEMRSLDEQVQEIKSDVLGIAAELNLLEERLLYPSNTQLSVFVALAEEETFRLDAVRIQLNGQLAAHHIYSYKELDALHSGGVQRIYTGNVSAGQHQMEVSVVGKLPNGKEFSQTDNFTFSKNVDPRLVGITLSGPDSGKPAIQIDDW